MIERPPDRRERVRSTGTDLLVVVWRLIAQGRNADARERLVLVWAHYMDGLESEQAGRVALRLFERLGLCTDDPDGWEHLPEQITVYRAGPPGPAWTTDRQVVESLARQHDLSPIRTATVAKKDVLAYITARGESELIVRPAPP